MIEVYYADKGTCFGGKIVMSRLMHNGVNDWLLIEAHEFDTPGTFATSVWTCTGDSVDSCPSETMTDVVKWMQEYNPSKHGFRNIEGQPNGGWRDAKNGVPTEVTVAANKLEWDFSDPKQLCPNY